MSATLGFSTLGQQRMPLEQIIALTRMSGVHGIELRLAEGEILSMDSSIASAAEVGRRLSEEGITLLALATYIGLAQATPGLTVEQDIAYGANELTRVAVLASAAGARAIRVFMKDAEASNRPIDGLTGGELLAIGRREGARSALDAHGVRVAIETHDTHATASRLRLFLDELTVRAPGVRTHTSVLWDTAHSWAAGESLSDSAKLLGGDVAHIQVKDVRSRQDPVPVELGTGRFPIEELAVVLAERGWRGWSCLEWERTWHPELTGLEHALRKFPRWAHALPGAER